MKIFKSRFTYSPSPRHSSRSHVPRNTVTGSQVPEFWKWEAPFRIQGSEFRSEVPGRRTLVLNSEKVRFLLGGSRFPFPGCCFTLPGTLVSDPKVPFSVCNLPEYDLPFPKFPFPFQFQFPTPCAGVQFHVGCRDAWIPLGHQINISVRKMNSAPATPIIMIPGHDSMSPPPTIIILGEDSMIPRPRFGIVCENFLIRDPES